MTDSTLYLVTDIEADGPDPGQHSMLSFACVATDATGDIAEFSMVMERLPGTEGDPRTMRWWATQPEAWAAATLDPVAPEEAMQRFVTWVRALPSEPVFTANPLVFDAAWMDWYLRRFAGTRLFRGPYEGPQLFHGAGVDICSLAMGVLGWSHDRAWAKEYPPGWLGEHAHTHCALDDARGYAVLLRQLLARRPLPFGG
jgi:hypothetical protein